MPGTVQGPRTLYDKVLDQHIVNEQSDGTVLLYIDRHLVHEVTSPVCSFNLCVQGLPLTARQQAFEGLRNAGRKVRRPDCTLATTDHVGLYPTRFVKILFLTRYRMYPPRPGKISRTSSNSSKNPILASNA